MAKRIGELLVDGGVLSQAQLEQALFSQRKDGRKLGQVLIELGLISEVQLTQTLSRQLSVPWVSLYHVDFSRQLLNLIPCDLADRYCLVPIFVRRVRKQGDTLYIAMDDPTYDGALAEVQRAAGLPVKPMIACQSDIRAAIRVYYFGQAAPPPPPPPSSSASTLGATSTPAARPIAASPAVGAARSPAAEQARASRPELAVRGPEAALDRSSDPPAAKMDPGPRSSLTFPGASAVPAAPPSRPTSAAQPASPPLIASSPPNAADSPEAAPEIYAEEREVAAPRRARPRMVSLTLLDGTTLSLPASGQRAPSRPHLDSPATEPQFNVQLTARDLVSALRAVSHGADASEILGAEPRWETLFSALLSIMLRKGLIADWEFIEEFRKI